MKKASQKTSAAKKTAKPATQKSASASANTPGAKEPIDKQPQVKQQAAIANGMFLYTDDAWSLRYFDANDLRFKEREAFG